MLRVVQEREIDNIGYPHPVKVNVRILAATHRNLKALVEDGQFREDLFYRLSVVTVNLPALRERKDDISLLVEHFLKKHCGRYRMLLVSVSEAALEMLVQISRKTLIYRIEKYDLLPAAGKAEAQTVPEHPDEESDD